MFGFDGDEIDWLGNFFDWWFGGGDVFGDFEKRVLWRFEFDGVYYLV